MTADPLHERRSAVSNQVGGGCTLGQGTAGRDPLLRVMAIAAAALLWRRRTMPAATASPSSGEQG